MSDRLREDVTGMRDKWSICSTTTNNIITQSVERVTWSDAKEHSTRLHKSLLSKWGLLYVFAFKSLRLTHTRTQKHRQTDRHREEQRHRDTRTDGQTEIDRQTDKQTDRCYLDSENICLFNSCFNPRLDLYVYFIFDIIHDLHSRNDLLMINNI